MELKYDCVVIGGGPGGCAVAALVAQKGYKTLLLERGLFPRFHIGESLMPESYWTFERLGVLPWLRQSTFIKKYSVQFINASGKESQPFYFDEMNPHECSQTWQVRRGEFDQMLLENAREKGAEVWQEANVTDVTLEPSSTDDLPRATGVVVSRANNSAQRISAKVVVDASGTNALLARKLRIRQADPKLRKASIFAHYSGCRRDEGKNGGATLVISTANQDGWFWYIPLEEDVMSVGVVGDVDRLITSRDSSPADTLAAEIAGCPGLRERMASAKLISDVKVLSDFSYRATRCAGDGWVLVGDAFGFLDPIYSSGVFLALKSGEMAADAIIDALGADDLSAQRLGRWGDELAGGMSAIRKLCYAFYTKGFSFGKFMKACPQYQKALVDLLIGDVFRGGADEIFTAMGAQIALPDPIPLQPPGRAQPAPEAQILST